MNKYIPNTDSQVTEMLSAIGKPDIDALFAELPSSVRLNRALDLPPTLSELEIDADARKMANKNTNTRTAVCFLGAGAYDHYIPSVIPHLLSRQEFYTAYTPYQPEISQGTLQAIFEFQTLLSRLTGMDVCNASMYDGATALAEAAALCCSSTRRKGVLVARSVHPQSRAVLNTYTRFHGTQVSEVAYQDGRIDLADLKAKLTPDVGAVLVQSPNFFGVIEDIPAIAALAHENKALCVVYADPIALGMLQPPGQQGADIVVGEGQSLGTPLSFGGPYVGFFCSKQELVRKLPGRIVGQTQDTEGRRGFVLTLQTREQHIRREKATSNICSNQALVALAATIYMSVMGKQGMREVADQCTRKAHYAYKTLLDTGRCASVFDSPFFREFVVKYNGDVDALNQKLLAEGMLGGYSLEKDYPELKGCWLVAVTEKRTKDEIDRLAKAVSL